MPRLQFQANELNISLANLIVLIAWLSRHHPLCPLHPTPRHHHKDAAGTARVLRLHHAAWWPSSHPPAAPHDNSQCAGLCAGIVILMLDAKMEPPVARHMVQGAPDALHSEFHLSYAMLLALARSETEVDAATLLRRSFRQFQALKALPSMQQRIARLQVSSPGCVTATALPPGPGSEAGMVCACWIESARSISAHCVRLVVDCGCSAVMVHCNVNLRYKIQVPLQPNPADVESQHDSSTSAEPSGPFPPDLQALLLRPWRHCQPNLTSYQHCA